MRICVIGPARFPVAEPFAGGLEAFIHSLVMRLAKHGHEVTLFGAAGCDPNLPATLIEAPKFRASELARADVGASPVGFIEEFHAYQSLIIELAENGRERFDVVLNCSIHPLPISASRLIPIPVLTSLHTPPTDLLESAIELRGEHASFVTVSEFMRRTWRQTVDARVIRNGVDVDKWRFGAGGGGAIWFGRLVHEKGVDAAITAAKLAGIPLTIAGPKHDPDYFDEHIAPHLGDHVRYLGHLRHDELNHAIGASAVALVTPRWDEPYGLVAAEALACGTPVVAFARGALPEIITPTTGRLVTANDTDALAAAIPQAASLDRAECRARAETFCSHERMTQAYEDRMAQLISEFADAGSAS